MKLADHFASFFSRRRKTLFTRRRPAVVEPIEARVVLAVFNVSGVIANGSV